MERNEVVCREANVSHSEEFVNKAAVKFMKKIIFKQKPKEIFKMIRLKSPKRLSSNIFKEELQSKERKKKCHK